MIDALVHGLAAAAFMVLSVALDNGVGSVWTMAVLNMLFWFMREVVQDQMKKKYGVVSRIWPFRWSSRKWLEFGVPTVVGFVVAAVMEVV